MAERVTDSLVLIEYNYCYIVFQVKTRNYYLMNKIALKNVNDDVELISSKKSNSLIQKLFYRKHLFVFL